MRWKQELDALMEITMAFAKDAKRQPMPKLPAAIVAAEQALAYTSKPIVRATTVTITPSTSERDEIRQRINNFRTHQEKMARDREGYYLQVNPRA